MRGVTFDDLEPAQLGGRIWFMRVVGQKLFLDTHYNGASKVGCSGCVFEVLRKLSDELGPPSCPRVAEVQMRYGFSWYQSQRRIKFPDSQLWLSLITKVRTFSVSAEIAAR
jgi:hypothetical protein